MLILVAVLAASRFAVPVATLMADAVAIAAAAYYFWKLERLTRQLLAAGPGSQAIGPVLPWNASSRQRRLMRKSLQSALHMTAHFGLYPDAAPRGHAIARRLGLVGE